MRSVSLLIILGIFTLASLVVQGVLPSLSSLHWILFTPIFFTYGALSLPFSGMLVLSVFTGCITDLSTFQVISGKIEIGIGWSIVAYSVLGACIRKAGSKAFLQGIWWIHPVLAAMCTFCLLTFYYIIITLHRGGGMILNTAVVWKVLAPSVMSFLFSPLIEGPLVFIEKILLPRRPANRGF